MSPYNALDMGHYVSAARRDGVLVVQPRMGMSTPEEMSAGLRAVADSDARTIATLTLDSYTRVGDHEGARRALATGRRLNGFPLVVHGPRVTARTAGAAGDRPVQVRHGSAKPYDIFATMADAGLTATEGGPVSYCLPYGRTPLAESVAAWRDATGLLVERSRQNGLRTHLETFGGCLLGQLCPPSLLIAMSALEALFFVQHGAESVSLSYAQQTDSVQDIEALAALRLLADELLPPSVDRHLVLYQYMGVYPRTREGAALLQRSGVDVAVRGGAERMIVKTVAEAHRIPHVSENVLALESSARHALVSRSRSRLPWHHQVDCTQVLEEARALVAPVLEHRDVGAGLLASFRSGLLDVPFCLHADNRGLSQGAIGDDGRLVWARSGRLPVAPARSRTGAGLRSEELLRMLNATAERHDRAALAGGRAAVTAAPGEREPYRIAVVGVGPRGLSVLERLAARLGDAPERPVEIWAIDAHEVGPGRIWRPEQSEVLLMNTPAGEVTMFSGPADGGPPRAGAGPALDAWWRTQEPEAAGAHAYAPRATYGKYLRFVLDAVAEGLGPRVTLHRRVDTVTAMRRPAGGTGWELSLAGGTTLHCDHAVLTTGHARPELSPDQRALADFAAARPALRYVRGDSAADMRLADVPAGAAVGVIGMGLAFFDVMALLTLGRGGRFETTEDGLRYVPGGREPRLLAGSRSGVPLPARGRNQKQATDRYRARIFTAELVRDLRTRGKLDFTRQVLPPLMAEVDLVRYARQIRAGAGEAAEKRFVEAAVRAALTAPDPHGAVLREAAAHPAAGPVTATDLAALARPFGDRTFEDRAAYREAVTELILADLREAAAGNRYGPLKAALDTLRDVRGTLCSAVDHAGLTAASHQEFLTGFVPLSSHLSAGPPAVRLQQVLALMEAGVLELVGPDARFTGDEETGRFSVRSPRVGGGPLPCDVLVDARIPAPDIRADPEPLTQDLRRRGLLTTFTNQDAGGVLETGGVHVTSGSHPVDVHGLPVTDLHVFGIPTEYTRWFTQVGSGRPGPWGLFTTDADTIAAELVSGLSAPAAPAPAARDQEAVL
ncbi:FAD/NAD(P)-binding protein [Streptomyces sp. NPDC052496]|uniref:FAD/NAD(P)-binding protein n=1 Tax=Streptomyces sp. NPDC052496 TaxID=3154951 RepID=UPI00343D73FE